MCKLHSVTLCDDPDISCVYLYYFEVLIKHSEWLSYIQGFTTIVVGYPLTFRQLSGNIVITKVKFKWDIPLKLARKSLSSNHFRTLFPEILVYQEYI